ncbi:hypothetical protein C9374_010473 [Naegleria lovaniensis]|uniref:F-box domain-containing protein n=1 Tax=Naegleria lovaniensis TaxID=51637 RepID=A0AA88GHM2_NAELO|nr:uncharacterized protein C9374_010473 [Naegleria lovaniensis]KAG2374729.1 hypothetical protein C9374_010473 [Naegleria lovaniensis]
MSCSENVDHDQPLAPPHCLKQFHDIVPKEIMIETLTYLPLSEMGNVLRISKSIHTILTETPLYLTRLLVSYGSNIDFPRSTIDTHLKTIENMSSTEDALAHLTCLLKEMIDYHKELEAKRKEEEMRRKLTLRKIAEIEKIKERLEQEKQQRQAKEKEAFMRLQMNRGNDHTK